MDSSGFYSNTCCYYLNAYDAISAGAGDVSYNKFMYPIHQRNLSIIPHQNKLLTSTYSLRVEGESETLRLILTLLPDPTQ